MHVQSYLVPDGVRQIGVHATWRPLAQDALGERLDAVPGGPAQHSTGLHGRNRLLLGLAHCFVQQSLLFAEVSADRNAPGNISGITSPFAAGINQQHLSRG